MMLLTQIFRIQKILLQITHTKSKLKTVYFVIIKGIYCISINHYFIKIIYLWDLVQFLSAKRYYRLEIFNL